MPGRKKKASNFLMETQEEVQKAVPAQHRLGQDLRYGAAIMIRKIKPNPMCPQATAKRGRKRSNGWIGR